MTDDDAKEACRLLLTAGVKREEITPGAVMVADAFIKQMTRILATRLIERLFPEWKVEQTGKADQHRVKPFLSTEL